MEKINVIYFDGRYSKGHKATLILMANEWVIEYFDTHFVHQLVKWEVNKIESHQSSDTLIRFKYGTFPKEIIECEAKTYEALASLYPQIKVIDKHFVGLLKKGYKAIIVAALVLAGIMAGIYFFILPPAAEFMADQIPVSYEMELGKSIYKSNMEHADINDSLTYWVNDFAKHIKFNTNYPIHITVVNEDIINAYAIPGGEIVVYKKIIQEMENKEELAALLAHEASHIHYRHSLKSISRSLSGYLFMSFLLGDVSGITAVIAENSHAIINLGYSRSLEEEADKKGLTILEANHISQYGFVSLFERMKKDRKDQEFDKFLSSHPLLNERIDYSKSIAQKQTRLDQNSALDEDWTYIKRLAHKEE